MGERRGTIQLFPAEMRGETSKWDKTRSPVVFYFWLKRWSYTNSSVKMPDPNA